MGAGGSADSFGWFCYSGFWQVADRDTVGLGVR